VRSLPRDYDTASCRELIQLDGDRCELREDNVEVFDDLLRDDCAKSTAIFPLPSESGRSRILLEFKRVIQNHLAGLGRLRLGHEIAGIQCGSFNADVAKWQKKQDLKSVRVKTLCGFESRHRQALR
jgi:hypothetical protein